MDENSANINSQINLLESETQKLLQFARKDIKKKDQTPFTAGTKAVLRERGQSAKLASTSKNASLLTSKDTNTKSSFKVFQDDIATPIDNLKKKKRTKKMSMSFDNTLDKTQDLFSQSQQRVTVEIIDDASPDNTPREGYSKQKAGSQLNSSVAEVNESENSIRNLQFSLENSRIKSRSEIFVPAPGISTEDVTKERQRLQKLEETARKMILNKEQEKIRRSNYLQKDISAILIQKHFRGHLGRIKFSLESKLRKIMDEEHLNDWIEVQDRETGDVWFYNKKTGKSQWERPDELFHFLAPKSTLDNTNTNSDFNDELAYDSKYFPRSSKNLFNSPTKLSSSLPSYETTVEAKNAKRIHDSRITDTVSPDKELYNEINKNLGIDTSLSRDKLTSLDGLFKPNLKETITNALSTTRFDSVSSVLADDRWMDSEKSEITDEKKVKGISKVYEEDKVRKDPYSKPIVSVMKVELEKESSKLKKIKLDSMDKNKIEKSKDLTIRNVEHYGAENLATLESENEHILSSLEGKPQYMCFGCWSCGSKRTCELHDSGDKIKPSETMLLCRNWELAVMRRRYRSEEIQEIFMKKSSSIRYDAKRKKFLAIEEQRHIIYKNFAQNLEKENLKLGILMRGKRWLYSIADQVMIGNVKGKKKEVQERTALMRLKRTLLNHAQVNKYGNLIVDRHPIPPTTGYSWGERLGQEQYLFNVPDPATGNNVELILIEPIPVPKFLYLPREYHLSAPKSIPMPKPDYEKRDRPIPANRFIDDMTKVAWFERICSTVARDTLDDVQNQIKAITPVPGLELLRREKQPPPTSVKFATIGKKPTPQNIDVGGLPVELLIYQLISTYFPPQYGSYMVMDKVVISPGFSPEIMITFESVLTPPVKSVCVIRPVEHPLNYRRAPTVAIHSKIKDELEGKHFYGANRAEQTGEMYSYGFRTTTFGKNTMVYVETDPQAFTPGTEVASLNTPAANKSNTTHADMSYPFCEPSSRDNTSLDFYHLLLEGVHSMPFTQIFTALSIQEPGFFLKDMNADLPMGALCVSTYRSWSFVQKDVIEQFKTDDGIPYWYHRKTGQTFWDRPLHEVEEKSPLIGGTVLDMEHSEEPGIFSTGENGLQRRYNQGEFRNLQNRHHETDPDAIFRREAASSSAKENRARGTFNPKQEEKPKEEARLDFQESDNNADDRSDRASVSSQEKPNNGETINPFGWSKTDPNAKEMAKASDAITNPTKVTDIFDPNNAKLEEERKKYLGAGSTVNSTSTDSKNSQLFGEKGQMPAGIDANMLQMLSSKVTELMSGVMDNGGSNEMIQMGLGMGVALMQAATGSLMGMVDGIVNPSVTSSDSSKNYPNGYDESAAREGLMPSVVEGQVPLGNQGNMKGQPIGQVKSTVKFASDVKLDHSEEEKQKEARIAEGQAKYTAEDEARHVIVTPMPTLTPDVVPPKVLTIELPKDAEEKNRGKIPVLVYPELSTLLPGGVPPDGYKTHPVAGLGTSWVLEKDYDKQAFVQGTELKLNKTVMPLPAGFFNAITKKHIAKAEVDYLPQVPNLPQPRVVGRVKPRSTALDWLAVAFDPWSAGKNPLGLEYVNSLSSKAENLFKGVGAGKALEQIDQLRSQTTADAFATVEDLDGMAVQRNEVSKQLILAQDFKRACTFVRHNKYQELEDMMNQPEWSVPIDYQDEAGNSMLHVACQNGNKKLVKLCLRRGANLQLQNLQGQTALHYAFGYGYDDVGEYLRRKGGDDSIINKDGLTCYEGLGSRELQLL